MQLPSLKLVLQFLLKSGWTKRERPGSDIIMMDSPYLTDDGNVFTMAFPAREDLKNYTQDITKRLETVAVLQNISFEKLVSKISPSLFDVVRVSVDDSVINNGTIPLGLAAEFVVELKKLMSYAATSEQNKAKHFVQASRTGGDYANECRFGHTFTGSFGFSVSSRVEEMPRPYLDGPIEQTPFERLVVQRISKGLHIASQAYSNDDTGAVVEAFEEGLNSNVADQIACLNEVAKNCGVNYSFEWSPEWFVPNEIRSRSYRVDYKFSEFLRKAARRMRSEQESITDTFKGRITGLSSPDVGNEDDEAGLYTVELGLESGSVAQKLNVSVSREEYLQAVQAHVNGTEVSLHAQLDKKARSWVVANRFSLDMGERKDFEIIKIIESSACTSKLDAIRLYYDKVEGAKLSPRQSGYYFKRLDKETDDKEDPVS